MKLYLETGEPVGEEDSPPGWDLTLHLGEWIRVTPLSDGTAFEVLCEDGRNMVCIRGEHDIAKKLWAQIGEALQHHHKETT